MNVPIGLPVYGQPQTGVLGGAAIPRPETLKDVLECTRNLLVEVLQGAQGINAHLTGPVLSGDKSTEPATDSIVYLANELRNLASAVRAEIVGMQSVL